MILMKQSRSWIGFTYASSYFTNLCMFCYSRSQNIVISCPIKLYNRYVWGISRLLFGLGPKYYADIHSLKDLCPVSLQRLQELSWPNLRCKKQTIFLYLTPSWLSSFESVRKWDLKENKQKHTWSNTNLLLGWTYFFYLL